MDDQDAVVIDVKLNGSFGLVHVYNGTASVRANVEAVDPDVAGVAQPQVSLSLTMYSDQGVSVTSPIFPDDLDRLIAMLEQLNDRYMVASALAEAATS